MATRFNNAPLIAIVGPTASGKSSLAVKIATRYDGEIICADSRTIYKGMDVGTAKPTISDQAKVPHWGINLVRPGEYFSAADFQAYAYQKIDEIRSRGHVPILVGGSGLYVDSVLFQFTFGPKVDSGLRGKLNGMSLDELYEYCNKNNILLPENDKNKRHVIRAIEQYGSPKKEQLHLLDNTIVVGITTDKAKLRTRIEDRAEQLLKDGVVEEAKNLGEIYGWDSEAMTGNIYPLIHLYLQGELTIDEMKQKNVTSDWRLAKRQLTWLRRNAFINWFPLSEAKTYLDQQLANSVQA